MAKLSNVDDFKLLSSFEAVRRTLLDDRYADRMDKPLAFWALPTDRRLPLAFLGRSIGDLLNTPYEHLASTPGIGHKKIVSLVKLLHRATNDNPPGVSYDFEEHVQNESNGNGHQLNGNGNGHATTAETVFDPATVSEALWVRWCETVRRHNQGHEKLGRLAPSLQQLPTVIWETPLDFYLDRTVAEIRELKTHGEKRVRAVLEVFHAIHTTLSSVSNETYLELCMVPRFVSAVQNWIAAATSTRTPANPEDVEQQLIRPLMKQIETDAGSMILYLVQSRLGINSPIVSVRDKATEMGVTRARVYQLLEECSKMFTVRWPEGHCHLNTLAEHLRNNDGDKSTLSLVTRLNELLYPSKAPAAAFGELAAQTV